MVEVEQDIGMVWVGQVIEVVGVEQGIGVVGVEQVAVGVEVELGTEEVVLGKDFVVEVQPGIDEVELVVVVVGVKHVVEMVAA